MSLRVDWKHKHGNMQLIVVLIYSCLWWNWQIEEGLMELEANPNPAVHQMNCKFLLKWLYCFFIICSICLLRIAMQLSSPSCPIESKEELAKSGKRQPHLTLADNWHNSKSASYIDCILLLSRSWTTVAGDSYHKFTNTCWSPFQK